MAKVTFQLHDGTSMEVDAKTGESLMQAAMTNLIDGIVAECGGSMSCATCHVYVDPAWIAQTGTASPEEAEMLELAVDPDETSRLSCQIEITDDLDGLIVRVPESQF